MDYYSRCRCSRNAGVDDRVDALLRSEPLEAGGDEIALDHGEQDSQVARVLVELLAPALALFLERLPRRVKRRAELNHDRRGDVGHHAERDDRHAFERSAREGVEEVEHAARLRLV